jgi:ATP-binding cassette subfamily F protein 3
MGQLVARGLTLRVAGRTLLEEADLQVMEGERLALIGPNGCGKTTLFRTLLGDLQADGGSLVWSRGVRVATVAQEPPGGEQTPLEVVLAADSERLALLQLVATSHDPAQLAEAHHRLVQIQAEAAPARAASLLAGLGFSFRMQNEPCRLLSGGWRGRVALAAALFAGADVLLLDEPTNHLDLEATLWLTAFLQRYPGTLILISHDRELLNAVPHRIIHVDQNKLVSYRGGLNDFLRQRAERAQRAEVLIAKQTAQRAKLQSFIDRFRAKASKARQAQSRMKALEKLPPIAELGDAAVYGFDFPDPDPLPSPLIEVEKGEAGYGEHVVLRELNLRIQGDDRIALLGSNGNGKTTLLKVLSGRLPLLGGKAEFRRGLRIGYFSQHQTEEYPLQATAVQCVRSAQTSWSEEQARGFLGRFGFGIQRADTPIGQLSGGEKARLLLCMISLNRPQLLILDEPTNHLDMESVEALVEALNQFSGAILLVSHDAGLIERCADTLWLVRDGTCRPFDGDLERYREECLATPAQESSAGGGSKRQQQRREAAQMRSALAPLRRQRDEAERAMQRLAEKKSQLEAALADPGLYEGPVHKLRELQKSEAHCREQLAAAEQHWLEVAESYEQAERDWETG